MWYLNLMHSAAHFITLPSAGDSCRTEKPKTAYASYITNMEKINLEREKANLKTRPIMTYEEWHKGTGVPETKDAPEKK